MINRLKLTMLLAFMAICFPLFSQNLSVQAPRVVAVGERFSVVFSAEGSKVEDFKWESGGDFNLVWGPVAGYSTSYVNNNGKSSRTETHTFSYVIEAKKEGRCSIPSASAVISGKECSSSEVSIEVIAASAPSSGGSTSGETSSGQTSRTSSDDVFISLSLNKKKVVVGEPIIATLKLYTNADLSGVESPQFPVFNGFWSQEIDAPVNLDFQRENVGGRLYQSALLRRYMIIPQQSGSLVIEPAEMVAVVIERNSPRGGASIFDSFFDNYQSIRKRLRTESITVDVSPLPSGAPESFKGGVGKFSMEVSVNKDTLKTHEAATLNVSITGTGNIVLTEPPQVSFPADFESYDVKTLSYGNSGKNPLTSGVRSYEYPFIPRSTGTFDLEPVEYTYYDIQSRKYVTLRSKPIRLTVLQGEEDKGGVFAPGVNRQSVKNLNEDIRFIATGEPGFRRSGHFFIASPAFYILTGAVIAVFAIVLVAGRKLIKRNSDLVSVRNRKATKMALKRLHAAGEYLKGGMYSAFYEELHKALLGYVSDKLSMAAVDMTKENIAGGLAGRGVDESTRDAFLGLIDACEFARYSPDAGNDAMQNHYNEAVNVISKIDGMIKARKNGRSGGVRTAVLVFALAVAGAGTVHAESAADNPMDAWAAANADYEDGDWAGAIEKYSSVLSAGYESDRLYYNMGNAYYKSGNLPYAILNYERALKLNPSFEDARNNLEMANGFTVDRIEKVPDFILKTWVDNLGLSMSSDGWAVLFIVLFAASAVVFLIFFFVRAVRAGKAALFVTGTVLFVFSLISLSFSFARKADYMSEDYGIVVSAVSSVRSSPSDENTKSLFVLHEGTTVEILEVLGDWSKVEIADGRQGWMEGKDIETI